MKRAFVIRLQKLFFNKGKEVGYLTTFIKTIYLRFLNI